MADSDVTLKVGLDVKDVESQAQQLRGKIENVFDKTNGKKMSSSFVHLKQSMRDLHTESTQVSKDLTDLTKQGSVEVQTKEYARWAKEAQKVGTKLQELQAKLNYFRNMPGGVGLQKPEYATTLRAFNKYQTLAGVAQTQMRNLEASGKKSTMVPVEQTQQYQDLIARQSQLNDRMQIANLRAQEMQNKMSGVKEAFTSARNAVSKIGQAFRRLLSLAGKLVGRLRGVNTGVEDTSKSMKNLLKFALKYGLGLRSIFILYKRLRSAGVEAYKGLASQFPELQRELNDLKNSFFQLKNSLATMAQPILSYLVPAIKTLMSWLTAAMNAMANFFAVLTGAKYIYKASKANKDWAKSAGGAGKAAKEANKDIAEYDNLMIIQQENDSSGGGGGGAADDYAGAFKKVKAESDLAKEIKDAINRGDWEGVGHALAKRLNDFQKRVDNWIQNKFRPTGKKWASRIARILNGLTDKWDAEQFGKTVSHGLMALMDIISTFWETYDWERLGQKVGDAIKGLFTEWEPKTVAKFLARKFRALAKFLAGLVANTPWSLVGKKLGETFKELFTGENGIPWRKLAEGISGALRGLMTTVRQFLESSDFGNSIAHAINEFLDGFDLKGFMVDIGKTANAIVRELGNAIKNVNWEEIGDAFGALITEIDWTEVFKTVIITAQKLLTVAQKIIKAIGEAITKIDWEEIGQALADLLASIDWGELIVTLIQVATSLIKGLGQALLKIASDPKALSSLATGLVTIFGAKWLWKKITGVFKTGLTNAISSASSGLGGVVNSALGKAFAGYALFEGGSSLVGSVGSVVAYALGDDKLSAEYAKMSKAPTQYLINAISTAVDAASEYSETTGRSTLSNAVRDMLGFEDVTETAIEKNLQLQADLNDKYYGENGIITQYNKKRLAREKALTDSMVANSNHYADIARKSAGVVSTAIQTAITSSNHYAQIAQSNAQKHTSSYAQMNQSAQHHAEIAKKNAGVLSESQKAMEESSNSYAKIAQANAKTHVSSDKQMEASSNHHLQIAKANAGVYEKIKQDAIDSSNHYVETAKANATGISDSAKTMTTNIENSVTTIPDSFNTTFTSAYDKVTTAFSGVTSFFGDVAQGVKSPFSTMADYFKDTFSTSWNGVVSVFKSNSPQFQSIQDSVSGVFKNSINSMIGGINNSLLSPFNTLSSMFSKMRGFSIGGAKIFSSLPSFNVPKIPKLAQGAVLPPNRPFMAMVGDQKQGTNVEAPLDTIVQALQIALENNSSSQPIVLNLNGRQIAQAVWDEENKTYKQTSQRYRYS